MAKKADLSRVLELQERLNDFTLLKDFWMLEKDV